MQQKKKKNKSKCHLKCDIKAPYIFYESDRMGPSKSMFAVTQFGLCKLAFQCKIIKTIVYLCFFSGFSIDFPFSFEKF